MRLTTAGSARYFTAAIVGRIVTDDPRPSSRRDCIRLFPEGAVHNTANLHGYRAVLAHDELETDVPVVDRMRDSDHLRAGDVVVLEGNSGFVRSLYRPHERHHSLFVTERCSRNCLMCSQPPKDKGRRGFPSGAESRADQADGTQA